MIKNLISQVILASSLSINCALVSLGGSAVKVNSNPIHHVSRNVILENPAEEQTSIIETEPNLNLKGKNSDTLYRIYMSSDGDKELPDQGSEKVNDYKIGKGKKNSWYKHLIYGISFDVTEYATDKLDFLSKYKAITFSYFYNYNFWNSWKGWTFEYHKDTPLLVDVKSFALTGNNEDWLLFDETDSSHSSNERANLVVTQQWNGNILSYNFYLGVCYYWKAGSTVKHASLASFKGDEYTFTRVPEDESKYSVELGNIENINSTFTINRSRESIDMAVLDNEIKRKALDLKGFGFKNVSILVQGYSGSIKVENTVYIFSLLVRWNNYPKQDSTLLLNGFNVLRDMSANYENGKLKINYHNSSDLGDESLSFDISEDYFGMEMKGTFFLPFIYN